jgi:hypothetical protein
MKSFKRFKLFKTFKPSDAASVTWMKQIFSEPSLRIVMQL